VTDISLSFANTVEWHAGPDPKERLTSYSKAVRWAQKEGILSDAQAQDLLAAARARPADEAEALRRIIALREAVYRIFSAVAHRRPPDSDDLETLNAELADALPHLRLAAAPAESDGETPNGGAPDKAVASEQGVLQRFTWRWSGVEGHLTSFLWPVARAATALLTSPELVRVRECAGDPCGWVFLDLSKNASRRWCDMADCGNRAKARRYRERKKQETGGGRLPASVPGMAVPSQDLLGPDRTRG
jgi:predicted RNA-binding Zn ribbon-like protein